MAAIFDILGYLRTSTHHGKAVEKIRNVVVTNVRASGLASTAGAISIENVITPCQAQSHVDSLDDFRHCIQALFALVTLPILPLAFPAAKNVRVGLAAAAPLELLLACARYVAANTC